MATSFSTVGSSSRREKQPRLEEVFPAAKLPKKKWASYRLLDISKHPYVAAAFIWVKKEVTKDGKTKEISFPVTPYNWDPVEARFKTKADGKEFANKDPFFEAEAGRLQVKYAVLAVAVDRAMKNKKKYASLKLSKHEKKTGCIASLEDADRTPIEVLLLPSGCIEDIEKQSSRNTVTVKDKTGKPVKKTMPLYDPKYGRIIDIMFDPDQPPAKMYAVQAGDRVPLEEGKYLSFNLVEAAKEHLTPNFSYEDQLKEAERAGFVESKASKKKAAAYYSDDEEDGDGEETLGKKSKKTKSKVKSKTADKVKVKAKTEDKVKSKVKAKTADKVKSKVKSTKTADKVKSKVKGKSPKSDLPF